MILNSLIVFSSISFLGYGFAYFKSAKMKNEFVRFGLNNYGAFVAVLEILGAIGLLIGLKNNYLLIFSSGGLALLMLLGAAVRIKIRDSLVETLPAIFFFFLNAYIFYSVLELMLGE